MKSKLLFLFLFSSSLLFSQSSLNFKFKVNGTTDEYSIDNLSNVVFQQEVKSIAIKSVTAETPAKNYKLDVNDQQKDFLSDGQYSTFFDFNFDIREIGITILNTSGNAVALPFILKKPQIDAGSQNQSTGTGIFPVEKNATDYVLNKLLDGYTLTNMPGIGNIIKKVSTANNLNYLSNYIGENYIHLFFDQNGNSIISSIPIGISRANYVVHIVYLAPENNLSLIDYSINQSLADINEGVIIRGEGSLGNNLNLQSGSGTTTTKLVWKHTELLLTGSSNDIKFDIVRNIYQLNNGQLSISNTNTVASRIIKIKKTYHGSLDVGIISTNLENPTFSLVNSPLDPNVKVVSRTNGGNRVLASAMYTFYVSPVILIQRYILGDKKIKNYQLEGRNFVEDHEIYQRIYPTFGIGLSDRLLDNLFGGFKWEFVRGGSVFVGYNWSKVNVLNVDADFEYGNSTITQESFDLKKDNRFRRDFCFGLNLDTRIIFNLFQKSTTP
ncbi:hypothetical protein [Flavobacterium sp.]|uniref:hypothetical protein n=1 Tax=Flavobacterium sp. TaxID=239 RepID=UPI002632F0F4|nr:hypothetical protein [Flavobacterium sp.]MDD2987137.1 hypothetical protein [Flavobacterium sp.]